MVDSENVSILSTSDLAMVLLVRTDDSARAMPTVRPREIGSVVEELAGLGIRAVKLFASSDARDCTGSQGKASDSLMARAIREAKAVHSSVIVMTETCLCSYTDSGECHLIDRTGHPDRLATIEAIAEQAVAQAAAGADVVGPAAMINGSVSWVRRALDETGHSEVQIMPHLIFDLRLYNAYRQTMDAAPASGERRVFQIDPARPETAVRASLGFVDEGADMLNGRQGDAAALLEAAAELAERFGATGETDSLGFWFGPTSIGLARMYRALVAGEPDQAAGILRDVDPQRHPFAVNRSFY